MCSHPPKKSWKSRKSRENENCRKSRKTSQTPGKVYIRTRIPAATNWNKFLCETKLRTTRALPSFPCGRQISRPFAPFGRFTHSPPRPMYSCSSTSTPRRSGNIPSHTSHLVFLSRPRPVSHLTPPGTRHSRPARPRGRPCLVTNTPLSAVHPPAVQLPHQKRVARCSQRIRHVIPAPAPHDSMALAPHDTTALAPSPRARSRDP